MSNADLKRIVRDLHATITRDINPDSIIDALFAKKIISDDDNLELRTIATSRDRCRRLLALLHVSTHPQTFVQFRDALTDEHMWIVDKIDRQLESSATGL